MAHFVCDFGLQTDRMAVEKVRGMDVTLHWSWWLTAHSATHGLAVSLLTGVPLLGLAEWTFHALIDWLKGRLMFSLFVDQALHVGCKVIWISALIMIKV